MMTLNLNNIEEVLEMITNSDAETKRAFREAMLAATAHINCDLPRVRSALRRLYNVDTYDAVLINWQWGRFERAAQ